MLGEGPFLAWLSPLCYLAVSQKRLTEEMTVFKVSRRGSAEDRGRIVCTSHLEVGNVALPHPRLIIAEINHS